MCLSITENHSLWAFKSDRLIPPVPHNCAIKVTKTMQLWLINIILVPSSVVYISSHLSNVVNDSFSPH